MDTNRPKPWYDDHPLLMIVPIDTDDHCGRCSRDHYNLYHNKQPKLDAILSSLTYIKNVLEGNMARCLAMFRMEKPAFLALCDCLHKGICRRIHDTS